MLGTKLSFKGATLACCPSKEQIPVASRASNVVCVKPVSLKTPLSLKVTICPLSVMEAGRHTLMRHARRLESTFAELRLRRRGWSHAGFYGKPTFEVKCVSPRSAHSRRQKGKLENRRRLFLACLSAEAHKWTVLSGIWPEAYSLSIHGDV